MELYLYSHMCLRVVHRTGEYLYVSVAWDWSALRPDRFVCVICDALSVIHTRLYWKRSVLVCLAAGRVATMKKLKTFEAARDAFAQQSCVCCD